MKNRLYELRTEQNLYQEQLAQKLNCSQQLISNYETGKLRRVPVDFEERLCNYFNCSIDYLRCRTNVRNEDKYSDTLVKIEKMIEEFYMGNDTKKGSKQDLSEEELSNFLEILSNFKDILKKFPTSN